MEHPEGLKWKRFDAALEHSKTVLSVLGAISDGLVMCEPLKGAVGLAKEVVAMIEKVRKNQKACTELARRIGALIFVILNELGGKKEEEVPDHLRSYLGNLARTLTDIKQGLIPLKLHKEFSFASFGSALLRRESVAEQLSGYNSQIDHAAQEFMIATLTNLTLGMNKLHIAQTSTSAIPRIQISSVVPTPPIYFYGRDDVVEDAVGKLSDKERPHIALLGTGGIGKTSVALALLDHQAIKSRNRCCFVPCDSLLTASELVQAIVQVLGGSSSSGGDPMEKLASLLNVGSVVLALDNFESPWDSGGTQTELTEVLRMLAASPNVRLIVTMRGNSPPAKGDVRWSPISLDPLSPDDAMKLFCSVNREITENEKPDLDLLLDKCGGLPLAIKLLASVKGDLPCSSLLHRWERQSTDMLKAEHDSPTRLTSVDVSISLSLDSKRMKGVPEAIALLGVICSLPDGVQGGIDQLIKMNLGLKDVDTALATILAASLAFRASDGSVKVLSPIRQYMLKHHPPSALLYGQLLQHYIRLADEYGDLDPNDMGFTEACAVLLPEVGNTTYLFKQELRRAQAGTRGVARAAFKFTNFQYWTRPSTDLIDDLLSRWPDCGLKVGHREGLVRRARLRQHISDYSAAKADLEYALAESTAVEDQNMVAQCLKTLGDVHLMQGEYPQAIEKLTRAHDVSSEIGDRQGVAGCLESLGDIHRMQGEYPQAIEKVTRAHDVYSEIGDRLGVANCLQSLGEIHRMQGEYPQAIEKLTRAREVYSEIGSRRGVANCLQSLGDIHYMQAEYPQAIEKLTRAHDVYSELGDRLGVTGSLQSLADIDRVQERYDQAAEKLGRALHHASSIGHRYRIACCYMYMGLLDRDQRRYAEAVEHITTAQAMLTEIGQEGNADYCSGLLREIHELTISQDEGGEGPVIASHARDATTT